MKTSGCKIKAKEFFKDVKQRLRDIKGRAKMSSLSNQLQKEMIKNSG